ncbi:hypothetical protein KPL74_05020 [Bacillus sp. NP157]|nr:hypothetical protein KPL74_05020 [Bacillus sp. NP157]
MKPHARLLAAIGTCLLGSHAFAADDAASRADATAIYKAVLAHWASDVKRPMNVAKQAGKPRAASTHEPLGCKDDASLKAMLHHSSYTVANLADLLGDDKQLRFIDTKRWRPAARGALIARDKAVDDAVKAGFAHGLFTLSAISFNEGHTAAVVEYSFVCGGLCGDGALLVFHKTANKWEEDPEACSTWISQRRPRLDDRRLAGAS